MILRALSCSRLGTLVAGSLLALLATAGCTEPRAAAPDAAPEPVDEDEGDVDSGNEASRIDDYLRGLPHLAADEPNLRETAQSLPERAGDYQCITQDLSETRQYDRIVAYAASSESMWSGAIVAGDSIYSGLFTQIVMPRKPATISVSLENLAGAKSATLEHPSLSSFREAVSEILDSELQGATPANIYSELEQVHSEEQLALALGARVSWLGGGAGIAASFDWSQQDVKSRYLVRYTQAYYTVDLDQPGRPSDFLADEVTLSDVSARMTPQNPPLYVSSVTYGRLIVFTFESEYSSDELNGALEFAYAGGVDVSGSVSVTYRDILSSSKITAFILGGSGAAAARTIDSYDALMDLIKSGGDYSKDSPGAPIAYKLSYLADNAPGRLSFTTDYQVQDCERVSQKVKVTLKSIHVEDDGADNDALEIYGWIKVVGIDEATLFDKPRSEMVIIPRSASWPTQGFASESIVHVTPQAGNTIQLRWRLVEDDGGLSGVLGESVQSAPFELGWRRDVAVLLTGLGARVTITFGLQPI